MSKTIEDLSKAIKRYLTSNTNLVNLVPGSAQNVNSLAAEIDDGILDAANNARVYAEELHDFAANGGQMGRAVLTFGAPLYLDRVPTKRFFSGTASQTIAAEDVQGIESSLSDWPELTLKADSNGSPVDVSSVQTVSFGGTVNSPLVDTQEYTVIQTRVNPDLTTTLVLGITPGTLLSVSGSSVIFNTGEIRRFKTIQSAWIGEGQVLRPIKVTTLKTKEIALHKQEGMSNFEFYPRDGEALQCYDKELTINGHFGTYSPKSDSVTLAVSGQTWMQPYTKPSDTDFLLENGFQFMMWQCLIELNYMLLKFVARQEGTIAPPTAARDAAWEALVLWDSHSIDGNIYHDL